MARKKKVNPLIEALNNEDDIYKKINECPVSEVTTLLYSQSIGHDKIDELLMEMAEIMDYAEKNKKDYPSNPLHVIEYLQYLCFKYFTTLEEALNSKEYDVNIVAFRNAYKKGWMQKVFDKLDLNEYGKVFDRFYETIEKSTQVATLNKDMQQELLNMIENKEVLNMYTARNVKAN